MSSKDSCWKKQAQHLSPHTVADYTNAFRKLQAYLVADVPFASITAAQVKGFLGDLATPRAPAGAAKRPAKGLSNKTILNIHTGLSALWTWAVAEGIVTQHLLRQIPRPRPEKRAITPFSEEDIKTLLANGERSTPTPGPANGRATTRWPPRCATGTSAPSSCCCSTPAYALRSSAAWRSRTPI